MAADGRRGRGPRPDRHDHSYQRWLPLDRDGNAAAGGLTQFVVGTGGHGFQGFVRTDPRLVAGADSLPNGNGALRLELLGSGATFRYVNSQGTVADSGSVACSGARPTRRRRRSRPA